MTLKLEVGKSYLTRGGEKVIIKEFNVGYKYPYGCEEYSYTEDGFHYIDDTSELDLIEEIQDEQPPTLTLPKQDYEFKTLRDEFAMAALSGYLSNPSLTNAMSEIVNDADSARKIYAATSYRIADAMLEARKKGGE